MPPPVDDDAEIWICFALRFDVQSTYVHSFDIDIRISGGLTDNKGRHYINTITRRWVHVYTMFILTCLLALVRVFALTMTPPDRDALTDMTSPDSRRTETQPSNLRRTEVFWSKHYNWLEDCGYLLRPRYRPEWIPSWQGTSKNPAECEDWIKPRVCRYILDGRS